MTTGEWARGAEREVIRPDDGHRFRWFRHGFPDEVARWNYHPEYELHLIRKSRGRFIVGDTVGTFGPGQVTLVGPGTPHDWVSFLEEGEVIHDRDSLVQFHPDWFEQCQSLMPELHELRPVLEQSRLGILFQGSTSATLARGIDLMGTQEGIPRVQTLLRLFAIMAEAPAADLVCLNADYVPRDSNRRSKELLDTALDYIFKNLAGEVRMSEAARIANMSQSAFSTHFRRASGFTFTEMTARFRTTHAKNLLTTTDDSIGSICRQVGYVNLSNFNRQFKKATGETPSRYRRASADPATRLR